MRIGSTSVSVLVLFWLLAGCNQNPEEPAQLAAVQPQITQGETPVFATRLPTLTGTALPPTLPPEATPSTPLPTATPTPFYTGPLSPACGTLLPILPAPESPSLSEIEPDEIALAHLRALLPETAIPAWERIRAAPDTVGLVVYRAGDEANGVYLNPDKQMPLASVAKLINLVAYVEAAGTGQLNGASTVPLAELDAYYLPGYDLGSHNRSLAELDENDQISGDPPQVQLADIPWMMIRHSSNAAADYIHRLLGQEVIEATAVELGLSGQTALCPWLGQFMSMANHTRSAANDRFALEHYLAEPAAYGEDISLYVDAYTGDPAFREAERDWHRQTRRPSVNTQRFFGQNLNAQGTAKNYADLMARLAQNGLSNPESSFLARKYLEWPMIFPANQELFSNLGYKNGSLPGILTTVYYAYPQGETTPIVLALFYEELPNRTYQQWRRNLPHDEFARWLLYEPAALPALRAVLSE